VSVDDRLQELLARLGRTLGDALAESEAAAEVVEAVRREGLSLYLRLEPKIHDDGSRGIQVVPVEETSPVEDWVDDAVRLPSSEAQMDVSDSGRRSAARLRRARHCAQPQRAGYRLDQTDVDVLRQLGIDPSRTGRSKPGRGKS
jgi:hypothetical protein